LIVKKGKKLWEYSYPSTSGNYGTQSTPTVDDECVYILSVQGEVLCFNAKKGTLQWRRNIVDDYGVLRPYYGFAGSPVIDGNLIILTANNAGLALDKRTGEKVWGSSRPPDNIRMFGSTGVYYSTPVVYDHDGKQVTVLFSWEGVHGVEVDNGKILWLHKDNDYLEEQVADPLIFDSKVFITMYFAESGCVLLDTKGEKPEILWKNLNLYSEISSPVLIDGYIYGCNGGPHMGNTSLRCLDAETGKLMWAEDLGVISFIAADDKLIILNNFGTLIIVEASPSSYREIARATVIKPMCWTPPVLCQGKIFCRNSRGDIVCIDVGK
jgi:outer membrane protein assembly factor BamB